MDTNTASHTHPPMKNHFLIIACLLDRIILTYLMYSFAADPIKLIPIFRLMDAVLFFLIALELKRAKGSGEADAWAGRFPYILYFAAGVFLIYECFTDFPNGYVTIFLYIASLVILYHTFLFDQGEKFDKFVPFQSAFLLVVILIYTFCVYYPIFEPQVNVTEGIVYSAMNLNLQPLLRQIAINFAHGGVIEEIIFRMFLLHHLKQMNIKDRAALLIQAILFASAHLGRGNVAVVISSFIGGLLFGFSYLKSKSLRPAIMGHTTYNVIIAIMTVYAYYHPA